MTSVLTPICSEADCDRPRSAKGLCPRHYMRNYKRKRYNRTPRSLWSTTIHPKTAHWRCQKLWGSASQHSCVDCGGRAQEWAYDGTDSTAIYRRVIDTGRGYWALFSRFPEFYMPLCLSCHRGRDHRAAALIVHRYRLEQHGV